MVELKVMLDSVKLDNMIFYAKIQIQPFLDCIKNIIDYFFMNNVIFYIIDFNTNMMGSIFLHLINKAIYGILFTFKININISNVENTNCSPYNKEREMKLIMTQNN
jgi:hypothetical protein